MKKILILLVSFLTIFTTSFSHGHFKRPEFAKGTEKAYIAYNTKQNLPLKVIIAKTKDTNKDVVYVWGWGRIFVNKTKNGLIDRNNNFEVINHKNGDITIKANVTMMDLYYKNPNKKGTFYHSTYGYLHSHVFPRLNENIIKIEDVDYEVIKNESYSPYDPSVLYKEKNGKFTFLYIGDPFNDKKSGLPEMAEFKFTARLHKTNLKNVTESNKK